jgi:MFS transporter, SHS family, lactate transporter
MLLMAGPVIINLVLFIILELGSGFTQTLGQFLGVRALYGIAMGGESGVCYSINPLNRC